MKKKQRLVPLSKAIDALYKAGEAPTSSGVLAKLLDFQTWVESVRSGVPRIDVEVRVGFQRRPPASRT